MNRPQIVVTVGTDHHPFDRLVRWVDGWSAAHPEADVFVQYGTAAAPDHAAGAALVDPAELRRRFAAASAVVTHGGLSSIMGARDAGYLPIVVARDPEQGEHVDGHQQAFALHQECRGRIALIRTEEELHGALASALADHDAFRRPSDGADIAASVDQLAGLVDDLLAEHPARHREGAP